MWIFITWSSFEAYEEQVRPDIWKQQCVKFSFLRSDNKVQLSRIAVPDLFL